MVLYSRSMSTNPAPLTWLEDVPTDVLAEAVDILEAVVRECALGGTPVRIFPFPSEYEHRSAPIGQEGHLKAQRSRVAEMLVRRGVLLGQRSVYLGGPYVAEADRGDWLVVEAEPARVRSTLDEVREHLRGREQYNRLPLNQRSAVPTPKWVGLPPSSITNFYGPTSIANVTNTGDHNSIVVTVGGADLAAIERLVEELKAAAAQLGLNGDARAELEAEIATLEAQVKSPRPKSNVLKAGLSSLAKILAGAAAHEVAGPLAQAVGQLLHHLPG